MKLMCIRIFSPFRSWTPPPTKEKEEYEEPRQPQEQQERRQPVFGGKVSVAERVSIKRHSKDESSRILIEKALRNNDFLKNLEKAQINGVVDAMYLENVEGNTLIIKEGDPGTHMYVAADGKFEVLKGGNVIGEIRVGAVFGELALLYNAERQASIRVVTESKVWTIERKVFQQIMVQTGQKTRDDNIRFLSSVPWFKDVQNNKVLAKISDLLRTEFYPADKVIIKQGDFGDSFFIIRAGQVKITKRQPGSEVEEEKGILKEEHFFGELALLNKDCRQATVTALSPGVECLVLDRESFEKFLCPVKEILSIDWNHRFEDKQPIEKPNDFANVEMKDLDFVATVGVGGFGRVALVEYRKGKKIFALKCLKKAQIVELQQQEHVFNEKRVMTQCKDCPFIIRLYRTYKDKKYIYFLMEPCLGGDVFTVLQKNRNFNEQTARFMTACVVEAFDYLHERHIVYRDLKPENLMLDARGYVKMVDFGFAKKLSPTSKTWTFAGTPEYVAPEIILSKGHDRAVDFWALGSLMHELLIGRPPFRGTDHMKTYNLILKGIDSVHIPKYVTKDASNLIRRLCRPVPTERLGYQRSGVEEIRNHMWFARVHFNWEALKKGTLKAPLVPQIKGSKDTQHFDNYPRDKEIPPDEISGWDEYF